MLMNWPGRISPSQQKMERSNMIEKSGSPVYTQVTECYYVTSQSVAVLENLGPIGSTKYIVEQKGDLPVYEVTPEGQKGKSRILHRNLLLPCDFLQSDLPKCGPQCTREFFGTFACYTVRSLSHAPCICAPKHLPLCASNYYLRKLQDCLN